MILTLHWAEHGKGDVVVELFERDFQSHVEFERLRRLRAVDNVAQHPRALIQLHHRDGVRRAWEGGAWYAHRPPALSTQSWGAPRAAPTRRRAKGTWAHGRLWFSWRSSGGASSRAWWLFPRPVCGRPLGRCSPMSRRRST